jgi:large subunit ribosomal protein L6
LEVILFQLFTLNADEKIMSRIGKLSISLPEKVMLTQAEGALSVQGPKGTLNLNIDPVVEVEVSDGTVLVRRRDESPRTRAMHGLTRKLVANLVEGVSQGFSRTLEISGVGYRAEAKDKALQLNLGFSRPIVFQLPPGVEARVDRQTVIILEGIDKQLLGETAAAIRRLRPPEPYKMKGIRYSQEVVRRKAGKTAGTR